MLPGLDCNKSEQRVERGGASQGTEVFAAKSVVQVRGLPWGMAREGMDLPKRAEEVLRSSRSHTGAGVLQADKDVFHSRE